MITFTTLEELIAHVQAFPGYLPSLRPTGQAWQETYNGMIHKAELWSYLQVVGTKGKYKRRECVVCERMDAATGDRIDFTLDLPVLSETDEGDPLIVQTFSGPSDLSAWSFSVTGHMERDGSDATPVNAALEEVPPGDPSIAYYRKSFANSAPYEVGLQNVIAAWTRCNEGDFIDLLIEAPDGMGGWFMAGQFARGIAVFGNNPGGTVYPPNQNPAMAWIPLGCRVRVDLYKLAENDTDLATARGPFVDVDVLGQRRI